MSKLARISGLAAVATLFAGMSYAQTITCGTPLAVAATTPSAANGNTAANAGAAVTPNPSLRAEGETELTSDTTASCTLAGGAPANASVTLTLSLPVTSKQVSATVNEATMVLSGAAVSGTPVNIQGTVTNNTVSFAIPNSGAGSLLAAGGAFTMQFSNIRINASNASTQQVTEAGVISYTSGALISNASIGSNVQVGYILPSLSSAIATGTVSTSQTVCAGNGNSIFGVAGTTSFSVKINELFGGAFKSSAAGPAGEGGSFQNATAGLGVANTATALVVTIANVPSAATVYLPATISSNAATASVLTVTGTALSAPSVYAGLVSFAPSSGTVTATYTLTTVGTVAAQNWTLPIIVAFNPNTVASQGAITATVAYTPQAALTAPATVVPTFAPASATPISGNSIANCQTTLLFPFVTNQLGFDTGIVLSNTTTDNLGFKGASSVTGQGGTCTLSFYGSGAPSPSTGVNDPGGNLATGTVHAFTVSSVAPGFQGYIIASCPMQYVHGFGFLSFDLTQNNGVAEGYLAEVLNRGGFAPAETPTF